MGAVGRTPSPALDDGIVIVATISEDGLTGTVYGVDAATGHETWQSSAHTGFLTSPVIDAGQVLVIDQNWEIFALDLRSGMERWRAGPLAGGLTPPTLTVGVVYVGDADLKFHILDATTGLEIGTSGFAMMASAPVFTTTSIYAVSDAGTLYKGDRASGNFKPLMHLNLASDENAVFISPFLSNTPAVTGGQIFIADAAGSISAYGNTAEGQPAAVVGVRLGAEALVPVGPWRRTVSQAPCIPLAPKSPCHDLPRSWSIAPDGKREPTYFSRPASDL